MLLACGCIACLGAHVITELGESKAEVAKMQAREYVGAFERWRTAHAGATRPPSIDELNAYTNFDLSRDPWGSHYVIACDGRDAVVMSPGPDERLGTADDITSY